MGSDLANTPPLSPELHKINAVMTDMGSVEQWDTSCAGPTLRSGTLSLSGETIARISLVTTGGAPGSADGAVPNSNLTTHKIKPKHICCHIVRPCNGIKALS